MTKASTIRPTAAVRRVLRDNGFDAYMMYTNKYEKCRTVKLSAGISHQVQEDILDTMKVLGVQGVTVRQINSRQSWGPSFRVRTVTIIRIPN